ncbi:ABC transporter substrate-binding protein [bacterium]|nr:ABC transporter substrate-binding protein [bacterium]
MAADTRFLKDARGLPVPAGPYRRVVSLVPSLTDTVFGLGAGERLVGRTIYCAEPRGRVRGVPTFGGTKNPDVAGIIAAAPDLVLVCEEENRREDVAALEAAGLKTFVVMPRSLDDVAQLLVDYGALLDAGPAAGRALSDLTAARLAAGKSRTARDEPPGVAVLIWKKPWMAVGGGNHINAMLGELGLRNVCGDRKGYPALTLESLAVLAPDLVLLPDEPFPFTHHDSWSLAAADVVASRRQAVLLDGKLLSWYGTRTARSLRTLVNLLDGIAKGRNR